MTSQLPPDNTSLYTQRYGRPPILPPPHAYGSRPPRTLRQRLAIAAVAMVAAMAGLVIVYYAVVLTLVTLYSFISPSL